jgi:serine/threonine-protein kinase RsbW
MTGSETAKSSPGFSVELPLALSAVETGRLALLDYLAPLALDDRVINRLEVVLEELVANVVRHADLATQLKLSASTDSDSIAICIEDDGAEFNPLATQENSPFDKLEDAAIGGLGIPLIKRLTRSVEYDRHGRFNRMRVVIAT